MKKTTRPALGQALFRMRKCTGTSQEKMGKILSIHQTALSRIENGVQTLSAIQLYLMSEYFQVPAHDIFNQKINYWDLAERFHQPHPYPKRYQTAYFSKVREVLPLISFLNTVSNEETARSILAQFEFDSVLFQHYDLSISVNFTLDLIRELLKRRLLTADSFNVLIRQTWLKDVHGSDLRETYDNQDSALKLIQARVMKAEHYESNFKYKIEEMNNKLIAISVTPSDYMKEICNTDHILGGFLCNYRKEYFKNFPLYNSFRPLKLEEHNCKETRNYECSYVLKTA